MNATVHRLDAADEIAAAAVPATHQIQIHGVWRDALLVPEVAQRLWGENNRAACQRVRALINGRRLFALTTGEHAGGSYLIPVDAYRAYLRGEPYPPAA